jgi:hypothetical protein
MNNSPEVIVAVLAPTPPAGRFRPATAVSLSLPSPDVGPATFGRTVVVIPRSLAGRADRRAAAAHLCKKIT